MPGCRLVHHVDESIVQHQKIRNEGEANVREPEVLVAYQYGGGFLVQAAALDRRLHAGFGRAQPSVDHALSVGRPIRRSEELPFLRADELSRILTVGVGQPDASIHAHVRHERVVRRKVGPVRAVS